MDDASTGEPQTGEPPPFTRSDLATARRMVRRRGVFDEADDIEQEVAFAVACYAGRIVVPAGSTPAEARRFVMTTIARRQAVLHRAARARRAMRGDEPVSTWERDDEARILARLRGAAPSVEDRILERGRIALLRAAVDELRTKAPKLYPVMKAELDGVPISLVAAQLRISRGTAYTRSRRGRAVVGAQLRRWERSDARGAARRWPDAEWERGRCG